MKFAAAAAAVLTAAGSPRSLSSFSDDGVATIKTNKDDVHRHPFAASRPWKKLAGRPQKFKHRAQTQNVVSSLLQAKLVAAQEGDLGEECDPSSANVLGILACGPGHYCVESSRLVAGEIGEDGIPVSVTSSLGGFCLKDASTNMGIMSRELQDTYNATSSIGYLSYICYNRTVDSENNPYETSCECNGIDIEAYTGFASCSDKVPYCWTRRGICEVNSTEMCSSFLYEYNFTGPYDDYTFSWCFDPVEPELLSSCATFTGPKGFRWVEKPTTCSFQVNGTDCNSCAPVECDYFGTGLMLSCYVYDCSNTAMTTVMGETPGYTLKHLFRILQGFPRLDKEKDLPCEGGCFLCGEGGSVTDGLYVTVPGFDDIFFENISCRYLEVEALSAVYGPAICSNDTYRSLCGCAVGDDENSPSTTGPPAPPVTPPTEENEGSSGASTTAIMTIGLQGMAFAVAAVVAAGLQ